MKNVVVLFKFMQDHKITDWVSVTENIGHIFHRAVTAKLLKIMKNVKKRDRNHSWSVFKKH